MKYLKLFENFEQGISLIPDNFIRLDSIGHVLDPEKGLMYAIWKNGGYDHENPYDVHGDNGIENISDEEKQIVDKFWLSCEDIKKDEINWKLIEMAKDLSLDHLDEGNELRIDVVVTENINRAFTYEDILFYVYQEVFSHDDEFVKWFKYFPSKMNVIKNKSLSYRFNVEPKRGYSKNWGLKNWEPEMTRELTSKLIEMFPDEIIMMR
jgi:hypothetical protein